MDLQGNGHDSFNTQPPEGGWLGRQMQQQQILMVSTHSRPKAAGVVVAGQGNQITFVSTHSRPKAAGCMIYQNEPPRVVSTHSRLKAAP